MAWILGGDGDPYDDDYAAGYAAGHRDAEENFKLDHPQRLILEVALALFRHDFPGFSWDDAPPTQRAGYLELAKVAVYVIRYGR